MADVILLSDSTTGADLTESGDIYFLAEGVTHYSTSGSVLDIFDNSGSPVTGQEVYVNGTMAAFDTRAITHTSSQQVSSLFISVGVTGRITSSPEWFAISIKSNFSAIINNGEIFGATAVSASGDFMRIVNHGIMSSTMTNPTQLFAIGLGGENVRIVNTGTISGGNGVQITGTGALVTNSGTIAGDRYGISSSLSSGEVGSFVNTGTIAGLVASFIGFNGADTVRNSGDMNGTVDLGDGVNVLINSGTITGTVTMGSAIDTLVNAGQITGDVETGGENDVVRNSGTITGDLDLGVGNDVLTTAGSGVVAGVVSGGSGMDSLFGGDLADELDGGDDSDFVVGRSGDDTLFGGAADDTVNGGSGEDALFGQGGADVLNGQGGNDTLNGGSGDDRLSGGNGDDTLIAGEGSDILRGDAGADVFEFSSILETGTGATRDRILGWEDGADVIDLSGFGALTFSAMGPVGGGTASVWFQSVSGGAQTMLRIDTDGDSIFDGQVLLVRADPGQFDQSDLILA
ncbi:MAG: calcium-binding protein [Pseudomonadota bacterium]